MTTTTLLDSEGNVGKDISFTIGADGPGHISYYDGTQQVTVTIKDVD